MKCKNCVRHVHLNDDGERTIGTPNWCFYLSDSPYEELERDCKAFKRSTNADRIRAMTDKELAEWLSRHLAVRREYDNNCKRTTAWLDWLKQEVNE